MYNFIILTTADFTVSEVVNSHNEHHEIQQPEKHSSLKTFLTNTLNESQLESFFAALQDENYAYLCLDTQSIFASQLNSSQQHGYIFFIEKTEKDKKPGLTPQAKDQRIKEIFAKNKGKKVLLIEDVPVAVKGAILILEKVGFQVDSIDTGARGLMYILSGAYDIVILDIGLPDMSGIEVIKQVRATSQMPIYALTGNTDSEQSLLDVGFTGVLRKPLSLEKLLDVLDERKDDVVQKVDTNNVINLNTSTSYDKATLTELLTMLSQSLPQDIQRLKRAVAEKNIAKVRDRLHAIRGSVCYAPVPELNAVVNDAYEKVKNSDCEDTLDNIFKPVFSASDRFLRECKKHLF